MDLILTHENADFDALASSVAAARLFPGSRVLLPELLQPNVRAFVNLYCDLLPLVDPKDVTKNIGTLIIVDTNRRQRLGRHAPLLEAAGKVIVFDHHPGELNFKAGQCIIEEVGATTTLMLRELKNKNIRLTDFEATLLALGIYEDTGSLTYDITTSHDARALADLWGYNLSTRLIQDYLHAPLSRLQKELFEKLIHHSEFYEIKGRRVLISATATSEYVIGASALLLLLDEIEDTGLTVIIVKMQENTYLAARSKDSDLNLLELLAPFGVKGYRQAVTAHIKKGDPIRLKKDLISHLEAAMQPGLSAQMVASAPVFTISSATTIAEADDLLSEQNIKGCPVVDQGELVGIISRRDLRKGLRSELGHAPVKGFMTRRLITAQPSSSLAHLRDLMVEHNIGRVLIVDANKRLAGIVTRSDILRHLNYLDRSGYKVQAKDQANGRRPSAVDYYFSRGGTVNIAALLKRRLSKETVALLEEVGRLAGAEKLKAFLVGGMIRDLLLKHPPEKDLDFVIIGDAVAFAFKLQKVLGGKLKYFERFKTASLQLEGEIRLDFATARKEYYQFPAALPRVEDSSLKEDLFRRDFTINAMACSLSEDNFGRLYDFYNGRRDLQKKLIRVLSEESFRDDPLRLLRAVRFEQRYNFALEANTARLAKKAVQAGMLERVGRQRLSHELRLIYRELSPVKVLKRFEQLKMLSRLYPGLNTSRATWQVIAKIEDILNWFSGLKWQKEPERELIYLGGLLWGLASEQRSAIIKKLYLSKEKSALLNSAFDEIAAAQKKLNWQELNPSQVVSFLEHLPPELLYLAYAVAEQAPVKEHLENYITRLRDIKPHLDGSDLKKMGIDPGPFYRQVMKRLTQAVLDEEVKGCTQELAFVEKYLNDYRRQEDY